MKRSRAALAALFGIVLTMMPAGGAYARVRDPRIFNSWMSLGRNIAENASAARELATFSFALKTAGLEGDLRAPGPFTVFAPLNDAFDDLGASALLVLMRPDHGGELRTLLRYHIVRGKYSSITLKRMMRHGLARLETLQGEDLLVTEEESGRLHVTDASGRTARVTIADVYNSNGVMHVLDTVMIP